MDWYKILLTTLLSKLTVTHMKLNFCFDKSKHKEIIDTDFKEILIWLKENYEIKKK